MDETIVFYYLEVLLSLLGTTIIFLRLLNGCFNFKRFLLLIATLAIPIFILIRFNQYFISSIIIAYSYSLVAITNIGWKRKVYITVLFRSVYLALITSSVLILRCFVQSNYVNYFIDVFVVGTLVLAILLVPKKSITEKFKNLLSFTSTGIKIYIVIFLYCLSLTAMIISFIPQNDSFITWYLLVFIFSAVLIVSAIILPLLLSNNISKNYYKRINQLEDEQIITQRIYYKKLLDNYSELRRFKHDYKNQLIVLQSYLEQDKIEYAKQYIKNSNEYVNSLERYHTGCFVFDALLDYKSQKAGKRNTSIKCSGNFNPLSLDDVDLCIIFGNALDNAIEACEKIVTETEKNISVTITQQNHILNVIITNPIYETPVLEKNTIETSKKDSDNHGFGLYSINRTIKKYDGTYSISCTDTTFSIQICLSI